MFLVKKAIQNNLFEVLKSLSVGNLISGTLHIIVNLAFCYFEIFLSLT